MLQPTDIALLEGLSLPAKTLLMYSLKAFNQDVTNIQHYCNGFDGNNAQLLQFHTNILNGSNEIISTIQQSEPQQLLSLLDHFAKP